MSVIHTYHSSYANSNSNTSTDHRYSNLLTSLKKLLPVLPLQWCCLFSLNSLCIKRSTMLKMLLHIFTCMMICLSHIVIQVTAQLIKRVKKKRKLQDFATSTHHPWPQDSGYQSQQETKDWLWFWSCHRHYSSSLWLSPPDLLPLLLYTF